MESNANSHKLIIDDFLKNAHINSNDHAGNTVKEIYLQTDKYILYKVNASKKIDEFRFAQAISCNNNEKENLYPYFYSIKMILSEVCMYPSYTTYKLEAISILGEAFLKTEQNDLDKNIDKLKENVNAELWRQQTSVKYYMLAGLCFVIFMITLFIVSYIATPNLEFIPQNIRDNIEIITHPIMACAVAACGGYFSMLHRINTYYYEGDNLNLKNSTSSTEPLNNKEISDPVKGLSILKALSRILISIIAGFIVYILLYSNLLNTLPLDMSKLSLDVQNNESWSHDFVIILFAFIAGFSEKLIPDFMLSYEKPIKKSNTQSTQSEKDMSQK